MNRTIKTLASLAWALILLCSHFMAQAAGQVGTYAPHWNLKTQSGQALSYTQFSGKPLVMHFWATWCPYCKKLQPGLEQLYQAHQKSGLNMVAISFNEDADATPGDVLAKRGISFATAVDGDNIARQYGVKGTPTTFVLDAAGRIQFVTHTSDPGDKALKQAIQKVLTSAQ